MSSSFGGIINTETDEIVVDWSNQMTDLANALVGECKRLGAKRFSDPSYDRLESAFKKEVYLANPHLDPRNMMKPDGTPCYTQRIDMERALGEHMLKKFSQLAGQDLNNIPVPFDITPQHGH